MSAIQLSSIHRQQEVSKMTDCGNHSPILSPQLGHMALSKWQASWQCWHPSFCKVCWIGWKYNSSNRIGTYRNDNTHSSFPLCSSYHPNWIVRILHCLIRSLSSILEGKPSHLIFSKLHPLFRKPPSWGTDRKLFNRNLRFPFTFSPLQFGFCIQCLTLNRCSTTAGRDLLIEAAH